MDKFIERMIIGLQVLATVMLLLAINKLGILPLKYFLVFGAVELLLIILSIKFAVNSKGQSAKVFSLIISVFLIGMSFLVDRTAITIEEIASNDAENVQINSVVVAVLSDNSAETLTDTAGYKFGVQYALKGEEITEVVALVNSELGKEILTVEYVNIQEQVQALYDGEVQAIIFNKAYTSLLDHWCLTP